MSDVPVTKEVLTPVTPVTGTVSLRAYARHRGVSATAVHRAVKSGRLTKSVTITAAGRPSINSIELADREWAASTDLTKAPTAVIVRAEQQQPPATPPPAEGAVEDEPGEELPEGDPNRTPTLSDALAREKHWSAKTKELEYKKRIGELVDARELEMRIVDEYSRCRTKLLGLPRKAKAALPHLSHADVVALDNLVREALEDIAGPRIKTDEPQQPS